MEYKFFLMLFFVALFVKEGMAAQHVVGGSQGWDESADFSSWTSSKKFKVGDQLAFKYTSGLHSVVELASESAYKNCDLGSPLDSLSTGNDVVKLSKEGTRYFACGTLGHCDQGMKVKITTETGTAPSTPDSSSSSHASASMASYSIRPFGSFVLVALATTLIYNMF
ncbi:mavicyanin [Ricinus communis]|uniref:Blue copper protein, putative n=1 Tax=Ricinus communis TaxID=3988 RepID=B9RBK2_RICCO|nr:mavicyanin [Ricinus communis]EEF50923.1 Blue copper protein precursor, putative [Ricinus communis]|eukprot:XP_002509536.1 mavicyanin [Ricinus communis]